MNWSLNGLACAVGRLQFSRSEVRSYLPTNLRDGAQLLVDYSALKRPAVVISSASQRRFGDRVSYGCLPEG